MDINFIPNDPLATNIFPMRQQPPRKERPKNRARFQYGNVPPKARYNFGTPEFLFWQSREAGMAALEAWESIDKKLRSWARSSNPKRLNLLPNDGTDLNAYYDGQSIAFFEFTTG